MYRLYMLQVIDKNTFLFYHHPFYVWGVSSCCGTLRQLCRSSLGICVCTSECQSIHNSCSCPSRTYEAECQVFALLAEVDDLVWDHNTFCPRVCSTLVVVAGGGWMRTSAEPHSPVPLSFLDTLESAEWDLYLCRALHHVAASEIQVCWFF